MFLLLFSLQVLNAGGKSGDRGFVFLFFFTYSFQSVILVSFADRSHMVMKQLAFPPVRVRQCVTVHVVIGRTRGLRGASRDLWEVSREQQARRRSEELLRSSA